MGQFRVGDGVFSRIIAKRTIEIKPGESPFVPAEAFAHVAGEHLNPKPAVAGRPSHAEVSRTRLNLTNREAMRQAGVEVGSVLLVKVNGGAQWFIHARVPNTLKVIFRPVASTPKMVNWVVESFCTERLLPAALSM